MSLYRTDALVLRTRNLGEADKILTLLTRSEGKISAAARGARRPRSRLLGGSQLFTLGRYSLFRRPGLHSLSQVEILEPFRPLREDLARMACASYAAELVDRFLPEGDPQPQVFALLVSIMHVLAWESEPRELESALRKYELRLLTLLGYRPFLEGCVRCRRSLDMEPDEAAREGLFFAPEAGGVLCSSCGGGPGSYPLGREALAVMRQILQADVGRLRIVRPSSAALAELGRCLPAWVDHHLGETPRSRAFLDSLQVTGSSRS